VPGVDSRVSVLWGEVVSRYELFSNIQVEINAILISYLICYPINYKLSLL